MAGPAMRRAENQWPPGWSPSAGSLGTRVLSQDSRPAHSLTVGWYDDARSAWRPAPSSCHSERSEESHCASQRACQAQLVPCHWHGLSVPSAHPTAAAVCAWADVDLAVVVSAVTPIEPPGAG